MRKLIKYSFAESVRDRVDVRVTNEDARGTFGTYTCKMGSILVDGEVVVNVAPHSLRKLTISIPIPTPRDAERRTVLIVQPRPGQKVPEGAQIGEFLDFPQACWEYVNGNLNESLKSADPVVSSLAVLNAKVGMQRLRRTSTQDLNPLTKGMLDFRMRAEREHRAATTALSS